MSDTSSSSPKQLPKAEHHQVGDGPDHTHVETTLVQSLEELPLLELSEARDGLTRVQGTMY